MLPSLEGIYNHLTSLGFLYTYHQYQNGICNHFLRRVSDTAVHIVLVYFSDNRLTSASGDPISDDLKQLSESFTTVEYGKEILDFVFEELSTPVKRLI